MTGTGTALDPYIITTRADLEAVNDHLDAYYELGADIDLAGGDWSPIGATGWGVDWNDTYAKFTGSFDGGGHKISNMTIDVSTFTVTPVCHAGLFCHLANGIVKGVHLCAASITFGDNGAEWCGLLAGCLHDGTVEHCSATGAITISAGANTSSRVGGLIGNCGTATIDACRTNVAIVVAGEEGMAGAQSVGGIAGYVSTYPQYPTVKQTSP
jgi:hypothetical protein